MSDTELHTPAGRVAAFAAFRARPYNRFLTRLRQWRAGKIRDAFADPAMMTLENFNREIWRIDGPVRLRGTPVSDHLLDSSLEDVRVAELETALENGELEIAGNTIWRPASSVYGSSLKESDASKEEHIRRVFSLLTDPKLAPFEKTKRITQISGFGLGSSNFLVMVAEPTAWALDNEQARSGIKRLGLPAADANELQVSASRLRSELQAADFIELDLFLYQLNQAPARPTGEGQIWWVNQGETYASHQAGGYIQASLTSADGRRVPAREAVSLVRPGDIIVHYAHGHIRAVSQVRSDPYIVTETDGTQRYRADTDYHQLRRPIPLDSVAQPIYDLNIPSGPMMKTLVPKQSYLHTLTRDGLRVVYDASPDNDWPAYVTTLLGINKAGGTRGTKTLKVDQIDSTLIPYEAVRRSLQRQGLFFPTEIVSTYLLALQAKGFVILTGISGTGKTQLAIEVARHFQPVIEQTVTAQPPDNARSYTVQKYNLQYHRMVLPVDVVDELGLTPDVDGSGQVMVYYPGGSTSQRLYKYPQRDTYVILFSGPFRSWFQANLRQGDTFFLEAVPENERDGIALRFSIPIAITQVNRVDNLKVIAVRPDWTDSRGLLGYYNPLTGRYESTPALRFLLEAHAEAELAAAQNRTPHPYFLILDEMNLARVEYYFADFLSTLESGEALELHDNPDVEAGIGAETEQFPIPRRLQVPRNVMITGTVNVDETTHMFSPKVLDRAFTIEFNQVDLTNYSAEPPSTPGDEPFALSALGRQLLIPDKVGRDDWTLFSQVLNGTALQIAVALNDCLALEQRHFGYRVANELARFVVLAKQQTDGSEESVWTALDLAILAKALPKLHGTQQELEEMLVRLFGFALGLADDGSALSADMILSQWYEERGKIVTRGGSPQTQVPRLPRTAAKLWRMLRRLRQQGFTTFVC